MENRRKFFKTAGGGVLGLGLLSLNPLKMFSKTQNKKQEKLEITAHPNAISRNGRNK